MTLDEMEVLVIEQGRELLRGLVQLGLDAQAAAEVRLARVTGADGVRADPRGARSCPDGGDEAGGGAGAADRLPGRGEGRAVAVPA